MPFAKLNISILPVNATVDFLIVLLKNLFVTCEHLFYIYDFVVKLIVDLVTIARFTYVSNKKKFNM